MHPAETQGRDAKKSISDHDGVADFRFLEATSPSSAAQYHSLSTCVVDEGCD
jgi:hypothetical protein